MLGKIFAKPSLAALFIGFLLLVVSASDKLAISNFSLTITSSFKYPLFGVALFTTLLSLIMLIIEERSLPRKNISTNNILEQTHQPQQDRDKTANLERVIYQIQNLVEGKDDIISQQIHQLIKGIIESYNQYATDSERLKFAAKWIKSKRDKWLKTIKKSDYTGISDLNKFNKEISRYIDLLTNNLEEQLYASPWKSGFSQPDNPFPYIRALESIREQMEEELKNNPAELDDITATLLKKYVDRLIQDIRH